ncbi:hypothetical protein [Lactococcus lactis]|uniref:hypothetical protein n=1 Tax=Lactococcus lactis TaxID=1358 RepID=UPI0032E41D18
MIYNLRFYIVLSIVIIAIFSYCNIKRKESVWAKHRRSPIKKKFEEKSEPMKIVIKGRFSPNALVTATQKSPKKILIQGEERTRYE